MAPRAILGTKPTPTALPRNQAAMTLPAISARPLPSTAQSDTLRTGIYLPTGTSYWSRRWTPRTPRPKKPAIFTQVPTPEHHNEHNVERQEETGNDTNGSYTLDKTSLDDPFLAQTGNTIHRRLLISGGTQSDSSSTTESTDSGVRMRPIPKIVPIASIHRQSATPSRENLTESDTDGTKTVTDTDCGTNAAGTLWISETTTTTFSRTLSSNSITGDLPPMRSDATTTRCRRRSTAVRSYSLLRTATCPRLWGHGGQRGGGPTPRR